MSRRRLLILAILFIIGLLILLYAGPGVNVVRGSMGDVVVVTFLSIVVGAFFRKWWMGALVAFAFAVGIECAQLFIATQNTARDVILGAVFDWGDFAAYMIGACVALVFEFHNHRLHRG